VRIPALGLFLLGVLTSFGRAEENNAAPAVAPATTAEEPSRDESDTITNSQRSKEKQFRRAEQEFLKWDLNANFVIDQEEWTALYEEKRAPISKDEWEQMPEKMATLDTDKDGKLTDEELNAWIKDRFQKLVKPYTRSELYKSRKAEYEKQQAPVAK
jgi:hypothetical protein